MIVLACLVGAVFFPIVGFDFVDLDVQGQVLDNPHVRGVTVENVWQIFTSRGTTSSYYPLRTLTYAIDCRLWGLNAGGFKLSNALIHLANVLLLYWLIFRLFRDPASAHEGTKVGREASVAAFSAGILAVHPVVVEPVAWVAGREELLMTLGALGCFHFHLTARRLEETGAKTGRIAACYVGAALCCAAACLSNAVAAVIPCLMVAWDVLALARPTLERILSGTAALWVIGVATIAIKKIGEYVDVPGHAAPFSPEWVMIVLNLYWVNLRTLIWPANLAVSYAEVAPRSFADPGVIVGAVCAGLTLAAVWKLRRRKLVVFGLVWFLLALAPAGSHVIPHHLHRADRFLYLPLVGLAVAMAIGLRPLSHRWRKPAGVGFAAAGALTLTVLGAASAVQVRTWQDAVSMWEQAARVEPNDATVRCALGDNLAKRGEYRRAVREYERSLELCPDAGRVMNTLAWLLAKCDDKSVRNYQRALHLAEKAFARDPGSFRYLSPVYSAYAESLAEKEQFADAAHYYRKAIELCPNERSIQLDLALLLATCSDANVRSPLEAVQMAERACESADPPDSRGLGILAEAYAEAGQLDAAVTTAERALALAQAAGQTEQAAQLRRRLERYRDRIAKDNKP